MKKINNGQDYIDSLKDRNLNVYLFGEKVIEPVDHNMIRPSINAGSPQAQRIQIGRMMQLEYKKTS
jgi:aromatic ring hydroxylase